MQYLASSYTHNSPMIFQMQPLMGNLYQKLPFW